MQRIKLNSFYVCLHSMDQSLDSIHFSSVLDAPRNKWINWNFSFSLASCFEKSWISYLKYYIIGDSRNGKTASISLSIFLRCCCDFKSTLMTVISFYSLHKNLTVNCLNYFNHLCYLNWLRVDIQPSPENIFLFP